jgi:hypothetical protein
LLFGQGAGNAQTTPWNFSTSSNLAPLQKVCTAEIRSATGDYDVASAEERKFRIRRGTMFSGVGNFLVKILLILNDQGFLNCYDLVVRARE